MSQNGEILYSAPGEDYIVFKESADAVKLTVKRIHEMTDTEILLALATAVRLPVFVRRDTPDGKL